MSSRLQHSLRFAASKIAKRLPQAVEELKRAFAARRTLTYARTPPDKLDRAVARKSTIEPEGALLR